jgi:hypothetical protein
MSQIYAGSYFTIAAALAADDDAGFLRTEPQRALFQGKILRFNFQGAVIQGLQTRKTHDVRDVSIVEPLSTRGWTLQERLLCKRLLAFTSGVNFECNSTSKCECGHSRYANPLYPASSKQNTIDKQYFQALVALDSANHASIYDYWAETLIPHYTSRVLTKDSDRLPAIRSLAIILEQKVGGQYISGMWKDDLLLSLSWHTNTTYPNKMKLKSASPDYVPCRLPDTHRAPSWSWASVEGPVVYGNRIMSLWTCSIVSVERDGINGKRLALKAPWLEMLVRLEMPLSEDSKIWVKVPDIPSDEYTEISGFFFDTLLDLIPAQRGNGTQYMSLERSRHGPDRSKNDLTATIFGLKLGVMKYTGAHVFLLLGRMIGQQESYQRIGYYWLAESQASTKYASWLREPPMQEVTIH